MRKLSELVESQKNMAKVKNVEGHYKKPSGYEDWLGYWEQNIGKKVQTCQKKGCSNGGKLEGGHVHKVGDDEAVYLVPICYDHNHYTYTDVYEVPENMLLLVPKEDLVRDILEDWLIEVEKSQNK